MTTRVDTVLDEIRLKAEIDIETFFVFIFAKSSFTNQSTTLLIFEVEKGDGYAGLDLITGTDYILDFMIQYSSTVQII